MSGIVRTCGVVAEAKQVSPLLGQTVGDLFVDFVVGSGVPAKNIGETELSLIFETMNAQEAFPLERRTIIIGY